MTIDLNLYRRYVKPVVAAFVLREPEADILDSTGRLAVSTNCHIIAVCYYLSEITGMTPPLAAFIARLMHFYKIDKVLNIQEAA